MSDILFGKRFRTLLRWKQVQIEYNKVSNIYIQYNNNNNNIDTIGQNVFVIR